ncbi:MAG: STAS/SEC14 domain-containing protein [Chloroflexi bacterium]|nr:STAS/SEC14 domain-containing protein [Chloroflexota bacterium]
MPVVQLEAQLSASELLKAVTQLSQRELDQFVSQVIVLTAQRRAPSLPHSEAELLQKINLGLSAEQWQRYRALVAKRRAETLTADEQQELITYSDQIEKANARRIAYLIELAKLRQTSLEALMNELGIKSLAYV